jgi:ribonuclease E
MPNKMLIDASHPEETRVVVTRGNRIEEFDFESRDKKQLRGNIYLARVTRVEPSLQAAFIEYGGNRHGFLAFSEIHPDYYQIPLADRQALLKQDAEDADLDDEEDEDKAKSRRRRGGKNRGRNSDQSRRDPEQSAKPSDSEASSDEEASTSDMQDDETAVDAETHADTDATDPAPVDGDSDDGPKTMLAEIEADSVSGSADEAARPSEEDSGANEIEEVANAGSGEDEVESVGAEDALEELPSRAPRRQNRRQYKIQEVIKRRQILLVQVVKEERGNKGAALTTYLSLAGRYSVLMPNTARGGGISRKITSALDRKRLKDLVEDLEVPQGMGVILRTAGANRTKPEIKRDYEYLMRMWETVRTLTLQSTAPALVYEEGSLIKRSVRDLYNKDIEEILVAGEDGYREAKDFMRMLMPSHAKVVQPYRDVVPIFARNGIEAQLDRMLQPQVTLKSGGYIIINQTEALVAIDVNSGRSTKEHSIEETALHTNLEAAEEVARQLRLRDLAGLIVIDFIDMEENRNNRAVEKRLKDHLKNDRARIQVGRISHFGLMEMSRQRIRASVLDSTMKPCPHCGGTGHVRSDSSVALHVVRAIEEFLIKDARSHITVRTPAATALYVLNHKRRNLSELEERFGLTISMEADETLGTQLYAITRGGAVERPVITTITDQPVPAPADPEDDFVEEVEADEEEVREVRDEPRERAARPAQAERRDADGEDGNRGRKRRRRRRRRGGRDREGSENAPHTQTGEQAGGDQSAHEEGDEDETDDEAPIAAGAVEAVDAEDSEPKKRRRGKRGGRRNRKDGDESGAEGDIQSTASADDESIAATVAAANEDGFAEAAADAVAEIVADEPVAADAPVKKPRRAPRKAKAAEAEPAAEAASEPIVVAEHVAPVPVNAEPAATAEKADDQPARPSRRRAGAADIDAPVVPKVVSTVATPEPATEDKPKKGGWWQRKSFF